MKKQISSKDYQKIYDEHILQQGMQFQIDTYYEPKEISKQRRIEILLETVNPKTDENIIDIGCGVGTCAFHLAKFGANTFGIDYSKESVKMAQRIVEKFNITDKAKFVVADAMALPFKNTSFDKAISNSFIEHINFEEKKVFLKEMYRILKPDGIGIIITPNGIREKIGEIYWKFRHIVLGDEIPIEELHFGLTTKLEFEPLLQKYKFNFKLIYIDTGRPYLARLPLIRNFLALCLLWIVKKK